MKTIGLIGGMSWESTVSYYQVINRKVQESLGGLHSAKCLLYSVDFQEIEQCQAQGDWAKSAEILVDAAQRLQRGGADFLVVCTNTMHKVAEMVQNAIEIPLLHIAGATAQELLSQGINKVGLLGTKYTMEQEFYRNRLTANGIEVLVPEKQQREEINRVIYQELCLGKIVSASRDYYLSVIDWLAGKGAQGVILGCTEIGLLVGQEDTKVSLFDTASIHAQKAAELALKS